MNPTIVNALVFTVLLIVGVTGYFIGKEREHRLTVRYILAGCDLITAITNEHQRLFDNDAATHLLFKDGDWHIALQQTGFAEDAFLAIED